MLQPAELSALLQSPKTLHFIGVGGSGMYPLAQILLAAGHTVQGSDVNEGAIIDYERALGMKITIGHRAENINGANLVVYSAAIGEDNPERRQAVARGVPCVERSVLLGYVASLYKRPLCIAGTHGKTTCTGMAVQVLEMAGLNPAAVIGGQLPLIGGYGKPGAGDGIVVEACEYHNTFLQLKPDTAVLLNVDDDHLEFFGSMENLKAAFAKFCNSAKSCVIYNGDDENTLDVMKAVRAPESLSFGFGRGCNIRAANPREYKPGFWAFDVLGGGPAIPVRLGAPGRHNIYNALAAYAGAARLGAGPEQIAGGLAAFGGTGRRFEILGENRGVTIADDYAHHPAELRAVLETALSMGFSSVWAVFQPYTYSRTQHLLNDFAQSLSLAPHVVMTEIMGGRENAKDYTVRTADLAAKLPGCRWFNTQQEVAAYVMARAKPGELVLTLGCGDIYKCAHIMLGL